MATPHPRETLKPADVIYVAGHRGMVGGALVRQLRARGFTNLLLRTRAELDLGDTRAVNAFYEKSRPDHVIIAAAKVGGIWANATYPVEFLSENLQIQLNLINGAHASRVKKLLFLGSSCIYPRLATQPMKEDALLTGSLEPTNEPYALARISFPPCRPIFMGRGIILTSRLPMSCPRFSINFISPGKTGKKASRFGARAALIANSCTWTIWRGPASS